LGVIPFLREAARLPAEDTVSLENAAANSSGTIRISVLQLPRIANFDDLDPLRLEPSVKLGFVRSGEAIPGDSHLVIIPGSKSTVSDLAALRREGWDIDLAAHVRRGGQVFGLCGGYQMLGRTIHDPEGLEGRAESVSGLGLLHVETVLKPDKTLTEVEARHLATGLPLRGYEIHLGATHGPDCQRPFAHVGDRPDGAQSRDGRIAGTYLHGCFASDGFRRAFLARLGATGDAFHYEAAVEDALDGLARHLESHLDIDRLLAMAAPV
jgi:adenosylcobyric acid synthase